MPSASQMPALLTSSLRYGVVARSYPLTGKVLKGYFDASGTLNGIGNGNPNAEFSPDVTRCTMTTDGGTARILWGFRTGAVAITTASKAMEAARPVGARWLRCAVGDAHEGAVEDAAWAFDGVNAPNFFVTGANDGCIKIWDAKRVVCLWTSALKPGQVVKDPCVRVAVDVITGSVAAALKSGELVIWIGLAPIFSEQRPAIECNVREFRLPAPKSTSTSGPYEASNSTIQSLYLHSDSPSKLSLLAAYKNESRLHRTTIMLPEGVMTNLSYEDESSGAITSIHPVFAAKPGEHSFVLVGDQLGSISIFPWNGAILATHVPHPNGSAVSDSIVHRIQPALKFQAHNDGAITALAWTSTVLVAGSSGGSLRAFDSLTLQPLRSFTYPPLRGGQEDEVKNIVIDRDFFAASVGARIVAWRGEPQGKSAKPLKARKSSKVSHGLAKYHRKTCYALLVVNDSDGATVEQIDITREIRESRQELDIEHAHTRRIYGREREQNTTLQHLGLTEVEAVEYALMLSRDEEEQRRLQHDLEVFGGEFDEDVSTPVVSRPNILDSTSSRHSERFSLGGARYAFSASNEKIQVSPRHRPEPMEAGFACSPLSRSASGSLSSSVSSSRNLTRTNSQIPTPEDPEHFPSISSTPTRRSVSGSPESARSAWTTPLRSARSSEGPSSPRGDSQNGSIASSPIVSRSPGVSLLSQQFAAALAVAEEEEELRFALELSLAEACSRGEDI